ncbi:cupin domain-containing protein [Pseudorhodobacter sp. E13]|uniref:cupin domain-containing protein n=1 Tax=Pseudorhodobacter sp. E13 TaxID=2487931 RepID=UPI000F8D8BB1|nr:cupin domain-containing protein [Pseudorhodobacter sp. E13]RUS58698.1 cupin domain-containing protein [Pseudorhodobacter sp. E13]
MTKLAIPALTEEAAYRHPVLGGGLGPYSYAVLGELGGLTQFGAHLEVLPPGSRSSFRHWHRDEDEFVMILSGQVMLIEDTETALVAGDVACWAKGAGPAHCLENRSEAEARYLVIGTRGQLDEIHYPDHDLIAVKDGAARHYTHLDGRPRRTGGQNDG